MSGPTRQKAASALGPAAPEAPASSEDHSGLEMDREQMLQLANEVAELLVARWENLPGEGAWEGDFVESLRDQLLTPPPEDGRPAGEVLQMAALEIMPIAARIDHPRFFGFIPSSPTWPGVLADFLVAGHQVNQCTWLTSSGPSQLELVVIDWIRQWVGYPEGAGGLLTSGGSVATITALVAAREAAVRDRKPTVYMSDQSHSAQIRAARIVGVEAEHVRLVASDRRFRLDMDALAHAMAADRAAGLNPHRGMRQRRSGQHRLDRSVAGNRGLFAARKECGCTSTPLMAASPWSRSRGGNSFAAWNERTRSDSTRTSGSSSRTRRAASW